MSTRFFMRTLPKVLVAAALIGCDKEATAPGTPSSVVTAFPGGPVTLEWQAQARALVSSNRLNPLAAGRVYAAISVAQERALETSETLFPTHAALPVLPIEQGGRSRFEARRGAVGSASMRVLAWLFPAAGPDLEKLLATQSHTGPGQVHPMFKRGVAIGRAAGDAMIEHLQNDRFTAPFTGPVLTGPDKWVPNSLPPAGGTMGSVKPYFLTSGSQFRPAPPPEFGSPAFNTDLNEVLTLTQNITPEQLAFARFWDFSAGTPTPPGFWNGTAADYVAQHELDEREATQVFSLMHAAMFDALIGCWDAKYHYWLLRPTQANPAISLAFPLPNHPSYPSGHSCQSAAAAEVLTHFFPDRATELAGFVSDAGLSRILAGIHYRFDITAGKALGRSVAAWAMARSGVR